MSQPIAAPKHFFRGAFIGIILTSALMVGFFFTVDSAIAKDSSILGLGTTHWLWILMATILLHQFLVWLVWRIQLCFNLMTRIFGKRDLLVWSIVFLPLFAARSVFTLFIGLADYGSLPGSRTLHIAAGIVLLLLSGFGFHSVLRFFGIYRALGGDHFREEYRRMPRVAEGMYRYSDNVMYIYVFLFFWTIGFLTGSLAGIVSALFQHALIWVHMYSTELPDMQVIYSDAESSQQTLG